MHRCPRGFTRIEVLAVCAALLTLTAVLVPGLWASNADSKRAVCYGNLRQIGRAGQVWGDEHADYLPWNLFISQGGTRPDQGSKPALAWQEFLFLSNTLSTPRLLACPADRAVRPAFNWTTGTGGFANSGARGNAVSYFINYHVQPSLARAVVTGDRDFRTSGPLNGSCSRGVFNVFSLALNDSQIAWTNEVHPPGGHLLFVDGSVEFASSSRLYSVFAGKEARNDTAGDIHFVNAR